MASESQPQVHLPRVAIRFCVQCKWNLRAAYYAQELLQTFSTALGEVSLIPVTGGIFTVTISYATETSTISDYVLWDRKTDGGFPETKELKNRVRNIVEPGRDLGHIDRSLGKGKGEDVGEPKEEAGVTLSGSGRETAPATDATLPPEQKEMTESTAKKCEDCT